MYSLQQIASFNLFSISQLVYRKIFTDEYCYPSG